jgi:hypothetical protein
MVGWTCSACRTGSRMLSTGVALELVPSRPAPCTWMCRRSTAPCFPRTGFTQGAVTDAEQSRGVGVQLSMSDASQRVRLGAGVTQSRFRNPFDPLLALDTTVVATRTERRRARYGELGVQLLRAMPLAGPGRASRAVTARQERVDPLYRSVGAFLQGDQQVDGERPHLCDGCARHQAATCAPGRQASAVDPAPRGPPVVRCRWRRPSMACSACRPAGGSPWPASPGREPRTRTTGSR